MPLLACAMHPPNEKYSFAESLTALTATQPQLTLATGPTGCIAHASPEDRR
jgi:hypothetical protein